MMQTQPRFSLTSTGSRPAAFSPASTSSLRSSMMPLAMNRCARCHQHRHMRGQRQDGSRHDVGGDDVVLAAGLVGQVADEDGKAVRHAVARGVLARGAHAHGVDVHALGGVCA